MAKKKPAFSNAANKRLAFKSKKGSRLIDYNHDGQSLRDRAIALHKRGRIVYYENVAPSKKHPAGSSYLYEVD